MLKGDNLKVLTKTAYEHLVAAVGKMKGTEVEYLAGKAIRQQSIDGMWYSGHGDQIRFKDFDPLWIKATRKIPK